MLKAGSRRCDGSIEDLFYARLERAEGRSHIESECADLRARELEDMVMRLMQHVELTDAERINIIDPYSGWEVDD